MTIEEKQPNADHSARFGAGEVPSRRRLPRPLPFARYSGVYGLVLVIAYFTIKLPGVFFSEVTLTTALASVAITGVLAIGVMIPFATGLFDLSFASVAGFSMVMMIWLSVETTYPEVVLAAVAIALATAVGVLNGLLVAYVKLESFVVTLAMSSVVLGLAEYLTKGAQIYGLFTPEFKDLGRGCIGPVPYLVIVLAVLAVVAWVWLEHTPAGRKALAVGSNPVASRLAGIHVARVQFLALLASGTIAGLAGVLLASQVGIASTVTGPGYLFPTIAAVFLGATQVRSRVNVGGTVIALLLIGAGIKGLQLSGAEPWVTHTFNGTILLIAIAAGTWRTRRASVGH